MIDLDHILTDILAREGWPTVTNLPADKGGLTKGGIVFTRYAAWSKLRKGRIVTPTDFVKEMSESDAREFLTDTIAGPIRCIEDIDCQLFASMFDWATTSGPDDPTRGLQRVLRSSGADIVEDGRWGGRTEAALLQAVLRGEVEWVRRELAKERVRFYGRVVSKDPTQAVFVSGWLDRALLFV